ncbi:MAG: gamma-glutamylcyclotransferase [Spirochaetia bacterium]|nr:gamma-glutamylcyclotransferase [Spirochaetia bacterium]
MSRLNLVFVYGTLKTGEDDHSIMDNLSAVLIGKGQLAENKYVIANCMGIPYLVEDQAQPQFVKGEIYSIPTAKFKELDRFEKGYTRVLLPVYNSSGDKREAYAYLCDFPEHIMSSSHCSLCYSYSNNQD